MFDLYQRVVMSILNYFQKNVSPNNSVDLPDPRGTLSRVIPSSAIALANEEIRRAVAVAQDLSQSHRRHYNKYTLKEKATIGKFALEHGVLSAKRKFSRQLGQSINESTVRSFKNKFSKERSRRRAAGEDSDIEELPEKKRGRKLLLGVKMDDMVKNYICKLRDKGCIINTAIVKAAARGLLMSEDKTRLQEFGGPATLTTAWSKSLLKRMNFTQRRGTTKASVSVGEFEKIKSAWFFARNRDDGEDGGNSD